MFICSHLGASNHRIGEVESVIYGLLNDTKKKKKNYIILTLDFSNSKYCYSDDRWWDQYKIDMGVCVWKRLELISHNKVSLILDATKIGKEVSVTPRFDFSLSTLVLHWLKKKKKHSDAPTMWHWQMNKTLGFILEIITNKREIHQPVYFAVCTLLLIDVPLDRPIPLLQKQKVTVDMQIKIWFKMIVYNAVEVQFASRSSKCA